MSEYKVLDDFALVRLDNGFYENKIITASGFELFLSEAYLSNPNIHITCTGTLMAVPGKIRKPEANTMDAYRRLLFREEIGFPDYGRETLQSMTGRHDELYKHVFSDSIEIELKEMDKVYFFHDGIDQEEKIGDYYKILYQNIICGIRDGEIIMNAAYCLLEEHLDDHKTSLITLNKIKSNKGIVRHIGTSLRGFGKICNEGDLVLYENNYDYPIEIIHKKYLVTPQYKIMAIL